MLANNERILLRGTERVYIRYYVMLQYEILLEKLIFFLKECSLSYWIK